MCRQGAGGSRRVQVPGNAFAEAWHLEEDKREDAAASQESRGNGVEHSSEMRRHDGQGHDEHVDGADSAAPGVWCGSPGLAQCPRVGGGGKTGPQDWQEGAEVWEEAAQRCHPG